MAKTYTYTARDAQDPANVVTITLYPRFARVNLTGLWDRLAAVGAADEILQAADDQIAPQAAALTLKLSKRSPDRFTSATYPPDTKGSTCS
jgi:hypothetical protein